MIKNNISLIVILVLNEIPVWSPDASNYITGA
jgi:hypothetical protein